MNSIWLNFLIRVVKIPVSSILAELVQRIHDHE